MDGVTDSPFRIITAKYGKPDVTFTEFTSVEGIAAGATKMLNAFLFGNAERPVVAQLFGSTPEAFYKAAFLVCELDFDGVDINMGCPAKSIAGKGAGASLILTPEIAKTIIRQTRRGCEDWAAGKTMEQAGLHQNVIAWLKTRRQPGEIDKPKGKTAKAGLVKTAIQKRKILPVSVKTRTGYDSVMIEEWTKHLLEAEPANISIHGRTLKQLYGGVADWEAIGRAAAIIHQTQTTVLGNGDIQSIPQALERIRQYGVDGALIGRAAFGNPWIFSGREGTVNERLQIAREHALTHQNTFGINHFMPMRKHLSWYCKGFSGAAEVRQKLMTAKSAVDVENILSSVIIRELHANEVSVAAAPSSHSNNVA
jgi:tRNA-dihydrouridine synthase